MKRLFAILLLIVLANATSAFADPLNITNIIGGWQNPVPAVTIVNAANQGTDTARWGTPIGQGGQSGYNFTPAGNIVPVILNTPFLLGTFQHVNQPITGTDLNTIQYSFSFSTNGVPATLSDVFDFAHNETSNSAPCAAGPEGPSVSVCDDFVFVSSVNLNQNIVVGSDTYFFNLLGFSKNGGATISTGFQSVENGTTTAGLYGVVTATPIPEPSSLMLLTLGGLALFARRRK